jgi:hypothetical protein
MMRGVSSRALEMSLSRGSVRSTDGLALAAGVGASGGQPVNNAGAMRSLVAHYPYKTRVSLGVEARSYTCRWRVAARGA